MGFFSVWVWVLGRGYLERENFNYEKEAWEAEKAKLKEQLIQLSVDCKLISNYAFFNGRFKHAKAQTTKRLNDSLFSIKKQEHNRIF